MMSVFLIQVKSGKNAKENTVEENIETINCNRALYATAPIVPQRKLIDDNDLQLLHAQANGLKSIYINNQSFIHDSATLVRQGRLVKLSDNPLYNLKELTHSYPYVTPEMAQLLNDIGLLFRSKLRERNQEYYRMLITSALRTNEAQSSLSRRNRNATEVSTHLFGTTVDITYKDFFNTRTDSIEQNHYAAQALRETMLDMREQCRLLVVREKRQACYHFTVVNCDPAKLPQDSVSKQALNRY
ncbi:MAG: DUF5715 family protein [Paludibacteraceae bacterium]